MALLLVTVATIWFTAPGAAELEQIGRGVYIRVNKPVNDADTVDILGFEYGINTRLENMPKHLLDALVASEDHRFYQRGSLYMVAKFIEAGSHCLLRKVTGTRTGACAGNSTITQQLAKILMVSEKQRSYSRKLVELVWALKLETVLSRQQILQIYANRIYLGESYFGVGMAARGYFQNDVANLNLYESALLAAAIQNPGRNPRSQPLANRERARLILNLMYKHGFIAQAVKLRRHYRGRIGERPAVIPYPRHMWFWLQKDISRALAKHPAGHYKVWTTMDPELQIYSEKHLNRTVNRLQAVSQGAVVVMRANGEVLAMVGGAGKDVAGRGRNRAIRNTGLFCPAAASTMKLVVYTAALEQGLLPDSLIDASPINHLDGNGRRYQPENHDGKTYGMVELRAAWSQSINTAAVHLLHGPVGFKLFWSMVKRLGIQVEQHSNELGVALGQNEVCPLDMTLAYATIANNGYRPGGTGIIGIVSESGWLVHRQRAQSRRVITPATAGHMDKLLHLSVARGSTGNRAAYALPALKIAGKTGTIDGFTGAWFIGYVEPLGGFVDAGDRLVIGVWLGNDTPKKIDGLYGGTAPAAVFNSVVRAIYRHTDYLVADADKP